MHHAGGCGRLCKVRVLHSSLVDTHPPSLSFSLLLSPSLSFSLLSAFLTDLALLRLSRAKALATGFDDTPEESSRPFDEQRSGFVIAEGSAVLVLEVRKRYKAMHHQLH